MSRRSCLNTLQERDENKADQNTVCPKKRKAEQCKIKTPAAKKQSFEIQNRWVEGDVSPCVLVETPHKELEESSNLSGFKRFRFKNLFIKPSPLPSLSWASSDDVWIKMLNKELKYIHDKTFMQQHPSLQPKMRAILLDWLLEVSEVYTLHRETFYLAQDFFDRFMLTQVAIGKNQLQLIGITSLFIASKLELLDLCILDINSLDYQYGVLAAAAFCHFTSIETVQKVSGLTWDSISSCVRWMAPFVRTVNEFGQPKLKDFKKVAAEDRHNIQTHVDYLSMLNDAQQRQQENLDRLSPVAVGGLLTPPKSTEKPTV
ncbi:G1/S-specific cyclin-E2 isoform X2 [Neoarius graeffei]|uniref:G1/S-specific cyclin-E2 isoform X2 n=1 Tax=Neoarius graeffei TaxID=443677 RepID=UPI00298C5FF3|nr:G1/S-specific cyclin-E2 isoform X2 [Neoarius graeffei]